MGSLLRSIIGRKMFLPLAFATPAFVACQLIAGIERVEKDARDAAVDARPVVDSAPPAPTDPCSHDYPPQPPEVDDGPDLPPFYLALRSIDFFGVKDGGTLIGYDLDRVCTGDLRPGAAYEGGTSCRAQVDPNDSEGGVDNAFGRLGLSFGALLGLAGDFDLAAPVEQGAQDLLVYVAGYDGRADDPHVRVGVTHGTGIYGRACADAGDGPEGGPYPPGWCGDDPWSVDPKAYGPDAAGEPTFTGDAYVRDWQLVLGTRPEQQSQAISAVFGALTLQIGSPIVSMHLVPLDVDLVPRDGAAAPSPAEAHLFAATAGIFTGRVDIAGLVYAVSHLVPNKDGGKPICADPVNFLLLKTELCGQGDITKSAVSDFAVNGTTNTLVDCDALSVGLTFDAFPIRVADARGGPGEAGVCDDDKLDFACAKGAP